MINRIEMSRRYAIISELHSLSIPYSQAKEILATSGIPYSDKIISRWERRFGRSFSGRIVVRRPRVFWDKSGIRAKDPIVRQIFEIVADERWNIEQLEKKSGVTAAAMLNMRSGAMKGPSIEKVRRLAEAVGLRWPKRLTAVDNAPGEAYVTGRGRDIGPGGIVLPARNAGAPYPLHSPALRSPA
jgi:transcriptional regulator with XRE-family HTH domain